MTMWFLKSGFTLYILYFCISSCTTFRLCRLQRRWYWNHVSISLGSHLSDSQVELGSVELLKCEICGFWQMFAGIKIIQKYGNSETENQTVIMECTDTLRCQTSITIHQCLNPPRYTCLAYNNDTEYTSSGVSPAIFKYATKITSLYIKHDKVADDTFFQTFKIGEVVEMICEGEIDSKNGMPYQDLMWCKNESGVISDLNLQEKPKIQNMKAFDSECEISQKSSIYYHIQPGDIDTEIICETGTKDKRTWWGRSRCGYGSHRKSIHIRAEQDLTSIMFGPTITDVYGKSIDGTYINTTAGGVTNVLRCMTQIPNRNDSQEIIRWCVKGKNDAIFKPVKLQNTATNNVIRNEMTATIYSDIYYHWTTNHSLTKHFLCELNYTDRCGSGTVRGNVTLRSNYFEDSGYERKDRCFDRDQSGHLEQSQNLSHRYFSKKEEESEHHVTLYIGVTLIIISLLVFVSSIVLMVYRKRYFLKAKQSGNSATHQLQEVQFIESSQHKNAGNSSDGLYSNECVIGKMDKGPVGQRSSKSVERTKQGKNLRKQKPSTESSTTYYGNVESSYECLNAEEIEGKSTYECL